MGLEISGEKITEIIGYIGDVFQDLSGLILLIVGVGLGLMVVVAIISAIRGTN